MGIEILPAALSAGASIFGSLFGGGKEDAPPPPQTYQLAGLPQADAGAMAGIAGLPAYNTWAQSLPYVQNMVGALANNPYSQLFQNRANQAGDIGWGTGLSQVGGGNTLMGAGASMLPYASSILNLGFDPQGDLYNRTAQQLTDQTRAGLSARGLANTPYGAGVENKALSDFNIDWQNNLLGRAGQAAQGAGYLTNSAGNAINLGQNVGTLGLQQLGTSAALPYSTFNTIGQNNLGAFNTLGQFGTNATNLANIPIDDYLRYLAAGTSANNTAVSNYQAQNQAQNQSFNQNQTLGKNLGAGIQGLAGLFKGGGGGFGGFGSSAVGSPLNLSGLY